MVIAKKQFYLDALKNDVNFVNVIAKKMNLDPTHLDIRNINGGGQASIYELFDHRHMCNQSFLLKVVDPLMVELQQTNKEDYFTSDDLNMIDSKRLKKISDATTEINSRFIKLYQNVTFAETAHYHFMKVCERKIMHRGSYIVTPVILILIERFENDLSDVTLNVDEIFRLFKMVTYQLTRLHNISDKGNSLCHLDISVDNICFNSVYMNNKLIKNFYLIDFESIHFRSKLVHVKEEKVYYAKQYFTPLLDVKRKTQNSLSDVYSLACVIIYLLNLNQPDYKAWNTNVGYKTTDLSFPFLLNAKSSRDVQIFALLKRMLHRNQKKRPTSEEVYNELTSILEGKKVKKKAFSKKTKVYVPDKKVKTRTNVMVHSTSRFTSLIVYTSYYYLLMLFLDTFMEDVSMLHAIQVLSLTLITNAMLYFTNITHVKEEVFFLNAMYLIMLGSIIYAAHNLQWNLVSDFYLNVNIPDKFRHIVKVNYVTLSSILGYIYNFIIMIVFPNFIEKQQ